jgi:hypothetical protein
MTGRRLGLALTVINIVVLLVLLGHDMPTTAQPDAPVIRGRALELADDRGQIRSRLNVESSGEVVFRMLDEAGTIRVKLGASADGSGLLLLDDATEPGVHMLARPTGPTVTLTGKDGQQLTLQP